jgi:hypothetical protein
MDYIRGVAAVFGVAYVLTGVAGFVPDLVTGGPPPDMPSADGSLFGIFPINMLHNVVHLVIGAALLYGATGTAAAVLMSKIVGVVYLAVGLLGFVAPDTFGLMPIGGADIALHLVTAAILLYLGFVAGERVTGTRGALTR